MRIVWDEQGISWFLDAGVYTGFHQALAEKIKPYLEQKDTLCDLGCGLGRLDLELAPNVFEVTAVDISERAIDVLRRDAEALGLKNIKAEVRDVTTLTEFFDVALLSFFGQSNIGKFSQLCRRRLIRIVGADNSSNFYPERYRCEARDTVPSVRGELEVLGVGYELEMCSIEFGQPLRSRHDAEAYVLRNAPEATAKEVNTFLKDRLESTGREDFPFYLPNKKELGIFIIDKEK